MSRPGWFDDLPEYLSEVEYRALPEDIARSIEVVHGHVIRCESPAPRHNRIARRLSFALESATPPPPPTACTPSTAPSSNSSSRSG